MDLSSRLRDAHQRGEPPSVVAYNRIDGPGSSLDLREFQQALWRVPDAALDIIADDTMEWTRKLPRTVGITVDTGTRIVAEPYEQRRIAVQSLDYNTNVQATSGEVTPNRDNWLLKVLDIFGLSGVKFVLSNIKSSTHSAGLGGSASATTGVCILANELAGRPFSSTQLVSLASRMEQDLGVSITGTQEQSNVVFGGVMDYVWFPWGIPGRPETGYGESLRSELISPRDYGQMESRMAIFHTGRTRSSTDVNSVWKEALATPEGYMLHVKKPAIAHQFREGLRTGNWNQVLESIREYREIRTALCCQYMAGAEQMLAEAEARGCTVFPLGAGGGGAVLVFGVDPDSLMDLRKRLTVCDYQDVPFKIRAKGHDLFHLPLHEE
jgi:galactokinase/mevalonate kinase-like predicted kinase